MSLRRPEAIFFDLDGTLIDSAFDLTRAIDQMLLELAVKISSGALLQDKAGAEGSVMEGVYSLSSVAGIEKVSAWIGDGAQALIERALADAITPVSDLIDVTDLVNQLYFEARFVFDRVYGDCCTQASGLYEGAQALLNNLKSKNIPLALITNKPEGFTRQILASLELISCFSVVVGGDTLAEKKPSSLPLVYCADKLDVNLDACWMVGDSSSDMQAAKTAGCTSIAVSYGYNHGRPIARENPDWQCDSLKQLHQQLLSLYSH